MRSKGCRYAVKWIAYNDESAERDAETVAGLPSVLLVADLYGKSEHDVAKAVLRERDRWNVDVTAAPGQK